MGCGWLVAPHSAQFDVCLFGLVGGVVVVLAFGQFIAARTVWLKCKPQYVVAGGLRWLGRARPSIRSWPAPPLRRLAQTKLRVGTEEEGRERRASWSVGLVAVRLIARSCAIVIVGGVGRSEVICLLPALVVTGDGGGGSGLAVLCCGPWVWREAVDPCLLGGVAVSSEVSSRVVVVHLLVIVAADFRLSCLRSVARAGRGCRSSPLVLSCSCLVVIGSSGPLLPSLSSLSCQLDRSLETCASTWLRVCVCVWRVIAGVSNL